MSITASTRPLPRKLSRTSTHAVAVPATALTAAQAAASPSVSFSAAIASGSVAACQNDTKPPPRALHTSAASGSRTTRLREAVAKRRASPPPARDQPAPAGRSITPASVAKRLLDLGHDPLAGVEETRVHLRPAVQSELRGRDREEAGRLVEAMATGGALEDGPVALPGEGL